MQCAPLDEICGLMMVKKVALKVPVNKIHPEMVDEQMSG
jgi:hypothetical protein